MPNPFDLPTRIALDLAEEGGVYSEPLGLNCQAILEVRTAAGKAWATLKVNARLPQWARAEARRRAAWEAGMAHMYAMEWFMEPIELRDGILVYEARISGASNIPVLLVTGRVRVTGLTLPMDLQECPRLGIPREEIEEAVKRIVEKTIVDPARRLAAEGELARVYEDPALLSTRLGDFSAVNSSVLEVLENLGFIHRLGDDRITVNPRSGLTYSYTRLLDEPVWCALRPLMTGARPREWDPRLCGGTGLCSSGEAVELMAQAGIPV